MEDETYSEAGSHRGKHFHDHLEEMHNVKSDVLIASRLFLNDFIDLLEDSLEDSLVF